MLRPARFDAGTASARTIRHQKNSAQFLGQLVQSA